MKKYTIPIVFLAGVGVASAQVTTILDFNGANFTSASESIVFYGVSDANVDFDLDGTNDDRTRISTLSSPTTSYTGPAFSGRFASSNLNNTSGVYDNRPNNTRVFNSTTNDALNWRAGSNNAGLTGDLTGLSVGWFTFAQSEWDAYKTGSISFNGDTDLLVTGENANVTYRFMVVSDGNYYVSKDANDITGIGNANFGIYNNANASHAIRFDTSAANTLGSALTNITEVGFYMEFDVANVNTGVNSTSSYLRFEVAAVPESSTYALFAGFATLGLVLLRRRLKA